MVVVNHTLQILAQSLGWLGAVLYLGAYYFVSTGKLAADSLRYQLMCIVSGTLTVFLASATGAWPSVFSNAVFVLIGFYVVMTVKRAYLKQLVYTKARRATQLRGRNNQTKRHLNNESIKSEPPLLRETTPHSDVAVVAQ